MSKKLLVCDLDNTLYDWIAYFVPSFYAMVERVVAITGCDQNKLLDDFRLVHQKHHDSEQPFALLETETIKQLYPNVSLDAVVRELDPAFRAFNSKRKQSLQLHAGVRKTLEILRHHGIKLVAHTESKLYGAVDRTRQVGAFRVLRTDLLQRKAHLDPSKGASLAQSFSHGEDCRAFATSDETEPCSPS